MGTNEQDLLRRIAERRALSEEVAPSVEVETPGLARGILASALQVGTLSLSDELGAAIRAIPSLFPGGVTPSESFTENLAAARLGLEQFREERPVVSTVAGLGGAVVQGVALAPLLPARIAAGGVKGIAALGAAEGGVAAAGAAEGGIGERLAAAPVGAAAGAAGAGVFSGAARLFRGASARALDFLNLRPATEAVPGVAGVATRAEQRLGQALPEELGPAREMLTGTDRPLSVMDVSENVRSLGRAIRGVEGEGREGISRFLGERVAGQERRVLDDALELTGLGQRGSIVDTVDEIVARRSADAADAYGAIADLTVEAPELGGILKRPAFRQAYDRARTIAANREGVQLPPLEDLVDDSGNLRIPLKIELLDRVKRGVDDLLDVGRRSPADAGGLGRESAAAIRSAKNDFIGIIDNAVPEYAQARSAFAGESALLDALDKGQDLFKMRPDEARKLLESFGDSEREMFVRGAFDSMATRVEDAAAGFDITKRRPLREATLDRQRLRLLFPDDASFEQFTNGLADEATIAATNRFVVGGSQTADKLAGLAEFAGVDLAAMGAVARGDVPSVLSRMVSGAVSGRRERFLGRLGEELEPSLTATGPQAVEVLERIERLRLQTGRQLTAGEAIAAVVPAVTAGALVGTSRRDERR